MTTNFRDKYPVHKSKEWIKLLNEATSEEEFDEIGMKLINSLIFIELAELTTARNAKSNSAMIACIKDINAKWNNIVSKITQPEWILVEDGVNIMLDKLGLNVTSAIKFEELISYMKSNF